MSTKTLKKQFMALDKQKDDKETRKTIKKKAERGIVYISHLPHGFYEKQLYKYLKQFGSVTNLRVGRSRISGKSKGFAFVEFKYMEVAEIVSQTMNNYLMFNKLVKCQLVPVEKVRRGAIFANKVKNLKNPPGLKARRIAIKRVNCSKTEEQDVKRIKRQTKTMSRKQEILTELGIDLDLSNFGAKKAKKLPTKSPVMVVDEEEKEIKMKTPPNIKKVMSRGATPSSKPGSSKNSPLENKPRELLLAKPVAERLNTPKSAKKISTPKSKYTAKRLKNSPTSAKK